MDHNQSLSISSAIPDPPDVGNPSPSIGKMPNHDEGEPPVNVNFIADLHICAEKAYTAEIIDAQPLIPKELKMTGDGAVRMKMVHTLAKPVVECCLRPVEAKSKTPIRMRSPYRQEDAKEKPITFAKNVAEDFTRNIVADVFDRGNKFSVNVNVREDPLRPPESPSSMDIFLPSSSKSKKPAEPVPTENVIQNRSFVPSVATSTKPADSQRAAIAAPKLKSRAMPQATVDVFRPPALGEDEDDYFYKLLNLMNNFKTMSSETGRNMADSVLCISCGYRSLDDEELIDSLCSTCFLSWSEN